MIPCLNGFTAEVREIKKGDWAGAWNCHLALVHKDFPIEYTSWNKVDALKHKDDPSKKIFGIDPYDYPCNVKKISFSDDIPSDDVIHIRYDKEAGTVTFKCTTFEYR